ncbi:hypothetical protein SOVF_091400 [Spinacia oleracea]|nr:hypothetical protein SOVF_091400 [Spinacia oleracea]
MYEHDTVLVPKETSWFRYFPDGAFSPLLPPQDSGLRRRIFILQTLVVAGSVKFGSVAGNQVGISDDDKKKHIVPYLKRQHGKFYNCKLKYVHVLPTRRLKFSKSNYEGLK